MLYNYYEYIKIVFMEKILKKDCMNLKLIRYRRQGAKIGENVRAFSKITSAEPYLIEIGNNVTISSEVKFTTHDSSIIKICKDKTDIFGRIKIGNNCFIGRSSIILPGVTLADNIIVGAGSVITKSFYKEGVVIAGNPAKVISDIKQYKEKYEKYALNVRGIDKNDKQKYILNNENKFICK